MCLVLKMISAMSAYVQTEQIEAIDGISTLQYVGIHQSRNLIVVSFACLILPRLALGTIFLQCMVAMPFHLRICRYCQLEENNLIESYSARNISSS